MYKFTYNRAEPHFVEKMTLPFPRWTPLPDETPECPETMRFEYRFEDGYGVDVFIFNSDGGAMLREFLYSEDGSVIGHGHQIGAFNKESAKSWLNSCVNKKSSSVQWRKERRGKLLAQFDTRVQESVNVL